MLLFIDIVQNILEILNNSNTEYKNDNKHNVKPIGSLL